MSGLLELNIKIGMDLGSGDTMKISLIRRGALLESFTTLKELEIFLKGYVKGTEASDENG